MRETEIFYEDNASGLAPGLPVSASEVPSILEMPQKILDLSDPQLDSMFKVINTFYVNAVLDCARILTLKNYMPGRKKDVGTSISVINTLIASFNRFIQEHDDLENRQQEFIVHCRLVLEKLFKLLTLSREIMRGKTVTPPKYDSGAEILHLSANIGVAAICLECLEKGIFQRKRSEKAIYELVELRHKMQSWQAALRSKSINFPWGVFLERINFYLCIVGHNTPDFRIADFPIQQPINLAIVNICRGLHSLRKNQGAYQLDPALQDPELKGFPIFIRLLNFLKATQDFASQSLEEQQTALIKLLNEIREITHPQLQTLMTEICIIYTVRVMTSVYQSIPGYHKVDVKVIDSLIHERLEKIQSVQQPGGKYELLLAYTEYWLIVTRIKYKNGFKQEDIENEITIIKSNVENLQNWQDEHSNAQFIIPNTAAAENIPAPPNASVPPRAFPIFIGILRINDDSLIEFKLRKIKQQLDDLHRYTQRKKSQDKRSRELGREVERNIHALRQAHKRKQDNFFYGVLVIIISVSILLFGNAIKNRMAAKKLKHKQQAEHINQKTESNIEKSAENNKNPNGSAITEPRQEPRSESVSDPIKENTLDTIDQPKSGQSH